MQPLEVVIALRGDKDDAVTSVKDQFAKTEIYALGQPAGDTSVPGQGTESDLLHFTIDDEDGTEKVLLPVFTRPDIMREALLRNPDWQTLSVLQINGQALLDNVDADVTIVINPWSRLEFQIPPPPAAPPSAN
jgi:SseB protein N-terminal domain